MKRRTETKGNLGAVEPHALDREAAFALEAVEELPPRQVVEHHVQLALGLESYSGGWTGCDERKTRWRCVRVRLGGAWKGEEAHTGTRASCVSGGEAGCAGATGSTHHSAYA